jgi:hypothetical protein
LLSGPKEQTLLMPCNSTSDFLAVAHDAAQLDIPCAGLYVRSVQVAFKEWEIVVDALGQGEQIILVRKGGIHEGQGGFRPEHRRFLLFPTRFHQQREFVVATAQKCFDDMHYLPAPAGFVRLESCAEVVEARRLGNLAQAKALRGQHIWRDEVIEQRFDWGKERAIYALAVRVFRLAAAVALPMNPTYGGCKSWVMLESDISLDGAVPVLDELAFEGKLTKFRTALQTAGAPAEDEAAQEPCRITEAEKPSAHTRIAD